MIEHPRPLTEPRLATPNGAQPAFPLAPPKAHPPAPPASPPGSEAAKLSRVLESMGRWLMNGTIR